MPFPELGADIGGPPLGLAITGATSWLGRALLGELAAAGRLPARLRLFAATARRVTIGHRALVMEALAGAPPLSGTPWLLLHFAFLGRERCADMTVSDYLAANDAILAEVLRIAAPAAPLRVVFASSGAVYGAQRRLVETPDASPYGWCKLVHERALMDWCAARGVPLVMPRIFNIGGPGVTKQAGYALSSMILAARRGGAIGIAARRPVFRSYVHVAELLGLLCDLALQPAPVTPLLFDTAGREIVEMADLAAEVARLHAPTTIRIQRDDAPQGAADWYIGDGQSYREMLAHRGRAVVGLPRIVADTADYLAEAAG